MGIKIKALPMHQQGQSMVEYIVVVFFSLMLLLAPLYDPDSGDESFKDFKYAKQKNAAGRNLNAIEALREVIKDNYSGYSYAVSLGEYPTTDDPIAQKIAQMESTLTPIIQQAKPYVGGLGGFSAESLGFPTEGPGF